MKKTQLLIQQWRTVSNQH